MCHPLLEGKNTIFYHESPLELHNLIPNLPNTPKIYIIGYNFITTCQIIELHQLIIQFHQNHDYVQTSKTSNNGINTYVHKQNNTHVIKPQK